jgi:hypothetical protein
MMKVFYAHDVSAPCSVGNRACCRIDFFHLAIYLFNNFLARLRAISNVGVEAAWVDRHPFSKKNTRNMHY